MCVHTATVCTGSSLLLITSFDMRTSLQRYITIPSYYTWCPKLDGPERSPSWEIQFPEKVLTLRGIRSINVFFCIFLSSTPDFPFLGPGKRGRLRGGGLSIHHNFEISSPLIEMDSTDGSREASFHRLLYANSFRLTQLSKMDVHVCDVVCRFGAQDEAVGAFVYLQKHTCQITLLHIHFTNVAFTILVFL